MVRVPENLNGFTVSGFYNVNSWFALGGEFSDLFGSDNQPVTSSPNFEDKVSLDRYVYLFGPQVTLQPGERVKVVGHLLAGGVSDRMDVNLPNGTMHFSTDAMALDAGVGVDFQVTRHFSVGPTFDYVPTHITSYTGNKWQNNWRAGVAVKCGF